jgi:MFS-type transporter involved in bile tolerance (Atg22 family)
MSFSSEASKLLTNKYFLYFMVFLTATNVLGYLVTNKVNAVIFFILVSLLTHQFSKNMAVVLLVSLIATNFLMANEMMREGFEADTSGDSPALVKAADRDPQIAEALPIVKTAKNNDDSSSIFTVL